MEFPKWLHKLFKDCIQKGFHGQTRWGKISYYVSLLENVHVHTKVSKKIGNIENCFTLSQGFLNFFDNDSF